MVSEGGTSDNLFSKIGTKLVLILREVVSKLLLQANKPKQIKLIRTKLKNNLTKNDN